MDFSKILNHKYNSSKINNAYEYLLKNDENSNNILVAQELVNLNISETSLLIVLTYDTNNLDLLSEEEKNTQQLIKQINSLNTSNMNENTYEDYRNLLILMAKNYEVIIIGLVYSLINIRQNKKESSKQVEQLAKRSLNIYAPIAHRLGLGEIKTELEEISFYILNYEDFKKIVDIIDQKKEERQIRLQTILEDIKEITKSSGIEFEIFGRNKNLYSIYQKLNKNQLDVSKIYDLHALRIICNTKSECYELLGLIHEKYPPIPGRFKDYIAVSKPNLYQSLHTVIVGDDGGIYEIQIRTEEMDKIAECGIAAHWSYKEGNAKKTNYLEEKLFLFRDVLNNEVKYEEIDDLQDSIFNSTIYTFTPNKKIVNLPKGSSVIDFAFKIHSKVAEEMVGAIVNGEIQHYADPLENGDVVEILTKRGANNINSEWLDYAKTTNARRKIKEHERSHWENNNEEKIEEGKNLYLEALDNEEIKIDYLNTDIKREKILRYFECSSKNKFYYEFYQRNITIEDLIEYDKNKEKKKIKYVTNDIFNKTDVIITGAEEIKIELAKCCMPVPYDQIVGSISTGIGIKVHRIECNNITNKMAYTMAAYWNENQIKNSKYLTEIKIISENDIDVIEKILKMLTSMQLGIKKINNNLNGEKLVIDLELLVANNEEIEKIKTRILENPKVIEVKRIKK